MVDWEQLDDRLEMESQVNANERVFFLGGRGGEVECAIEYYCRSVGLHVDRTIAAIHCMSTSAS